MFVEKIKEIHVEPTTVCQAECSMCIRTVQGFHKNKSLNRELSLERFQELTKDLILNLEKILFCGNRGDPIACKQLIPMIEWVQNINPKITVGINTNGAIQTTSWWQKLAELTRKNIYSYVVFSIDGFEDTNHIYRTNVSWKKLISNAKSYINAGGVAHWDMLVFEHNKHQVDDARNLAKDMGFRAFRTKVSSRFDSCQTESMPPNGKMPEILNSKFSCMAKDTSSVYLSADGFWFPCCYLNDEYSRYVDNTWGKMLTSIDDRQTEWKELEMTLLKNPLPVCKKSCGTTFRTGQWKSEIFFS